MTKKTESKSNSKMADLIRIQGLVYTNLKDLSIPIKKQKFLYLIT